jgi:hypothetical protein
MFSDTDCGEGSGCGLLDRDSVKSDRRMQEF